MFPIGNETIWNQNQVVIIYFDKIIYRFWRKLLLFKQNDLKSKANLL